jgi:tetratricopeptide (TPR) repeat protein
LAPLRVTPVAFHYAFIAGVGIAVALVQAAELSYRALERGAIPRAAYLAPGALLIFLATSAAETSHVIAAWKSDETLYSSTILNHHEAVEPRINLAAAYLEQQRYDEASVLLEQAERLAPRDLMLVRNQFSLLWQTNQLQAAIGLLDRHPDLSRDPGLLIGRGEALERLERHDAARAAFQQAFDYSAATPKTDEHFMAGYRWLVELIRAQRFSEAQELLQRLLKEDPSREEFLRSRGLLF